MKNTQPLRGKESSKGVDGGAGQSASCQQVAFYLIYIKAKLKKIN